MTKGIGNILAMTAASGLLAGLAACGPSKAGDGPAVPSDMAPGNMAEQDQGCNACKGQNSCKGQGGCKTDTNGCKGQNACKGQGGCDTCKA